MERQRLVELQLARANWQAAHDRAEELRRQMEASPLGQEFLRALDEMNDLHETLAQVEERVRADALAEFHATGRKQVGPGVQVKMHKLVEWDEDKLLPWLEQQAPVYVKRAVNGPAVKRAAEDLLLLDAPLVIRQEGKVYIATDLSAVLAASAVEA
jgi:hypothetical protein